MGELSLDWLVGFVLMFICSEKPSYRFAFYRV
jgi:hypothetical protein